MGDWYRRTTWTEEDRVDFNARLQRAREKAQYLRIQAVHLAEAGEHQAALELLDRFIRDYPEDLQVAQAHLQRAESLAHGGQTEAAIIAFQQSLAAQRKFPNVRTQAWLLYPWFIVEHRLEDSYNEANATLDEFYEESSVSFPIEEYRYYATRALLAEDNGDLAAASTFAKQAMIASKKTHSGYRYHPDVGLVHSPSSTVHERIAVLNST